MMTVLLRGAAAVGGSTPAIAARGIGSIGSVVSAGTGGGGRLVLALLAVEELPVPLEAAVDGDEHDGDTVGGEERADRVELGCEDAKDDECEGELADGRPHVRTLERPLGGSDLDESAGGGRGPRCKRGFVPTGRGE